jgi:hypothetical protein
LTAAIAVVAKSNVPSFALKFTCVEGPIGASDTPAIYTTLTDVTRILRAAGLPPQILRRQFQPRDLNRHRRLLNQRRRRITPLRAAQ